MKLPLLFFTLFSAVLAATAPAQEPPRMLRFYEDNDLINISGRYTDRAYSNGTRADLFYTPAKVPRSFAHRLMPRAGDSSTTTLGWGLMQIMITPTDISKAVPEAGDHHYSGSLFLVHSLHSFNEQKKLGLQSEWVVGVMGPPSLAKETQVFIHRLTGSTVPRGWDHQLATDLLLNYNFTVEKGLFRLRNAVEAVGGLQAFTGTMHSGAALYGTLRAGRLMPHFQSYIGQHLGGPGTLQWYVLLRPGVELTAYNALLEGGFFSEAPSRPAEGEASPHVRRLVTRCDFGFGVSLPNLSLSFTQKTMSSMIKGLPDHTVGNISVAVGF